MVVASVSPRDIKRSLLKITASLHLLVNLGQTTNDGRASTLATTTGIDVAMVVRTAELTGHDFLSTATVRLTTIIDYFVLFKFK